jgi:hypothetical protein
MHLKSLSEEAKKLINSSLKDALTTAAQARIRSG